MQVVDNESLRRWLNKLVNRCVHLDMKSTRFFLLLITAAGLWFAGVTMAGATGAREHYARQADQLLQHAQIAREGLQANLKRTDRWPARRKARLLEESTGQLIDQARRLRNAIAKGEELPKLRRMVDDLVSVNHVVRFAWNDVRLAGVVNEAYERVFRDVTDFKRLAGG